MDIRSNEEMKDFAFNIVEVLTSEREKRGMSPTHTTRNEIYQYIQNRIKKSLWELEAEEKIKSTEAWNRNNRFYQINKK
jgi:hypothetical protein